MNNYIFSIVFFCLDSMVGINSSFQPDSLIDEDGDGDEVDEAMFVSDVNMQYKLEEFVASTFLIYN